MLYLFYGTSGQSANRGKSFLNYFGISDGTIYGSDSIEFRPIKASLLPAEFYEKVVAVSIVTAGALYSLYFGFDTASIDLSIGVLVPLYFIFKIISYSRDKILARKVSGKIIHLEDSEIKRITKITNKFRNIKQIYGKSCRGTLTEGI